MHEASLFALASAMTILVVGCVDGCRNNVVARVESPGGTHSAVLFQRGCGATTGLSTQISVLPAGDQPVHEGNAFRADTGHRASVRVGAWQGPWAEMHWLSQRHLRIRYAAGARPFAQVSEVNGISISFEPVPAPSPVRP